MTAAPRRSATWRCRDGAPCWCGQRRRMVCDNCDSRFLEDHPAFEGALTGRLARRLVADAKVMTFSAAARSHGVHWHACARPGGHVVGPGR